MVYTAERIKELFLEYSAHEWTDQEVYINGMGMIQELDQWFLDQWRLILTNKKSPGAQILLEKVERVLKEAKRQDFFMKVPRKCQWIWHFPTHLEYPPVRILTKSVKNANNAIVKVKVQFIVPK